MRGRVNKSLSKRHMRQQQNTNHSLQVVLREDQNNVTLVRQQLLPYLPSLVRLFQRIDEHRRHIKSGLLFDFLKTGRTGDIQFCHVIANYVQSYQQ